ncbi:LysE/ArgO family amino acid transporter [Vibrio sp. WJH972]
MNIWVLLQGLTLGLGMIIPIGAQNAYVLNQGIKRQHYLTTAFTCGLMDFTFICIGIFGGGALLTSSPLLLEIVTISGILFLSVYGLLSFRSMFSRAHRQEPLEASTDQTKKRITVVLGALAVSVLNPHVYIDTIVILGSLGGKFEGIDRMSFAIGTIIASFSWFFLLATAASKLSTTLSKPKVQMSIDFLVGTIMLYIAFTLWLSL